MIRRERSKRGRKPTHPARKGAEAFVEQLEGALWAAHSASVARAALARGVDPAEADRLQRIVGAWRQAWQALGERVLDDPNASEAISVTPDRPGDPVIEEPLTDLGGAAIYATRRPAPFMRSILAHAAKHYRGGVEALARAVGRDPATLKSYRAGKASVPVDVLRILKRELGQDALDAAVAAAVAEPSPKELAP